MSHLLGVQPIIPAPPVPVTAFVAVTRRVAPRPRLASSRPFQPTLSVTNCPPVNQITIPHLCGYPDSTNSGWSPTGTTLSTYTGAATINTPGLTLDSQHFIDFGITINAANVTISRSWFDFSNNCNPNTPICGGCVDPCGGCSGPTMITLTNNATNFQLVDTELSGAFNGVGADNTTATFTITRCYFHAMGGESVFTPRNPGSVTIQDSAFLAMNWACNSGGHIQTVRVQTGPLTNGITITHNTLEALPNTPVTGTGALFFKPDFGGSVSGYDIENNLVTGGQRGLEFRDSGANTVTGGTLKNNRFVPGTDGDPFMDHSPTTQSGNVHDSDNTPILF